MKSFASRPGWKAFLLLVLGAAHGAANPFAEFRPQNPVMAGADPHAILLDGTVWMYPTHRSDPHRFFAYASSDLLAWTEHGPILDFNQIPWIKEDGSDVHFAWAPSIERREGRFYFYYSVGPQGKTPSRIGVAVGDAPAGPFRDSGRPLLIGGNGFEAIDPKVFTDPQSGASYFYAGGSAGATLRVFEMNPDMISFAREIEVETPPHFTEGPFVHFRNGVYYLSYSHGYWRGASYSAHYATSDSPEGPWQYQGAFLRSDNRHKGPGHHSILNAPGTDEWFVFYHRWNNQEGSGPFRGSRRIAIDRLEHDEEGRIAPVVMTDASDGWFSLGVPGVVINHSPKASGLYIGSPSLAILPNGDYVASHDFFGPNSREWESPAVLVFRSSDRGRNWEQIAHLESLFWAGLFTHRGVLHILGTDRHNGRIVIRRSADRGRTWSEPRDAASGLLTLEEGFHTAPMPVVEHDGRLWRAFEQTALKGKGGERHHAGMLSIATKADLLKAGNWQFSNFLPGNPDWLEGRFQGWLEGNAVVTPDGRVANILRVDTPDLPEQAAILRISQDGKVARFEPENGFIRFPGGAKKFTIRHDARSGFYWSIASMAPERHAGAGRPAGIRNMLALVRSPDLIEWEVRSILLDHPDVISHGFQYVDWLFEGDDIVAVCRTAYEDGEEGAHNNHDANFLTFHRFRDFRARAMEDSTGQDHATN